MLDSSVSANVDLGVVEHSLLGKRATVRWIWPYEKESPESGVIVAVWRSPWGTGATVFVTVACETRHVTVNLRENNPQLALLGGA